MTARFDVVWTDTALHDLLGIVDYIADRDDTDATEHVYEMIADAARGLETMPQRCWIVTELDAEGIKGYHELLVGPYRVVFSIHTTTVVILTTLDGRRDLGELLMDAPSAATSEVESQRGFWATTSMRASHSSVDSGRVRIERVGERRALRIPNARSPRGVRSTG